MGDSSSCHWMLVAECAVRIGCYDEGSRYDLEGVVSEDEKLVVELGEVVEDLTVASADTLQALLGGRTWAMEKAGAYPTGVGCSIGVGGQGYEPSAEGGKRDRAGDMETGKLAAEGSVEV